MSSLSTGWVGPEVPWLGFTLGEALLVDELTFVVDTLPFGSVDTSTGAESTGSDSIDSLPSAGEQAAINAQTPGTMGRYTELMIMDGFPTVNLVRNRDQIRSIFLARGTTNHCTREPVARARLRNVGVSAACKNSCGRYTRWLRVVLLAGAPWVGAGCDSAKSSAPSAPSDTLSSRARKDRGAVPERLLAIEGNAHQGRLHSDDGVFYLFADGKGYRLVPGATALPLPLPVGEEVAFWEGEVALWRRGAIERFRLSTSERIDEVAMPTRPLGLSAWRDSFAWLERASDGASLIHSSAADQPVYRSRGSVDVLVQLSDWLFFVERRPDRLWHIGRVPSGGGAPEFASARPGRAPARLVSEEDALYYYDGNAREVRRLAADLQQEVVVGREIVCSPLASAGQVFCARVEGVFGLATSERPVPIARGGPSRLITDIAASREHVAWVNEAGANRLEVHVVAR